MHPAKGTITWSKIRIVLRVSQRDLQGPKNHSSKVANVHTQKKASRILQIELVKSTIESCRERIPRGERYIRCHITETSDLYTSIIYNHLYALMDVRCMVAGFMARPTGHQPARHTRSTNWPINTNKPRNKQVHTVTPRWTNNRFNRSAWFHCLQQEWYLDIMLGCQRRPRNKNNQALSRSQVEASEMAWHHTMPAALASLKLQQFDSLWFLRQARDHPQVLGTWCLVAPSKKI